MLHIITAPRGTGAARRVTGIVRAGCPVPGHAHVAPHERRADTLPLPPTTGQAIAEYLRLERTQTSSRALFVRCIAPQGHPLGPDGVAKVIRQAYARAELSGHSAHALRHTLASRLSASGGSLKEVADVLRHRSLDTTLIYAKLDTPSLSEVALPWPGEVA